MSTEKDGQRILGAMIYGITCFSLFFSLVGTVLGGSGQINHGEDLGLGRQRKWGSSYCDMERHTPACQVVGHS